MPACVRLIISRLYSCHDLSYISVCTPPSLANASPHPSYIENLQLVGLAHQPGWLWNGSFFLCMAPDGGGLGHDLVASAELPSVFRRMLWFKGQQFADGLLRSPQYLGSNGTLSSIATVSPLCLRR